MVSIIDKKINELQIELQKQVYSNQDDVEIDKLVQEYRKDLVEAKKGEYARNQEIIKARIETLEELKKEEIEEEKKNVALGQPTSTI